MSMFCYQCQETAVNKGCAGKRGVCGKTDQVADLQDLAIHVSKGLAYVNVRAHEVGVYDKAASMVVNDLLYATLTNVNFDPDYFVAKIEEILKLRDALESKLGNNLVVSATNRVV